MSGKSGFFESETIKAGIPRDLGIDNSKEQRSMLDKLLSSPLSPFHKRTMADVFVYSLALACNMKLNPLKLKKRAANIPSSSFRDEDLALIFSISLNNLTDINELNNSERVKQIISDAEELANAGLVELYEMIFGSEAGDPDRRMERYILDVYKNAKKSDKK